MKDSTKVALFIAIRPFALRQSSRLALVKSLRSKGWRTVAATARGPGYDGLREHYDEVYDIPYRRSLHPLSECRSAMGIRRLLTLERPAMISCYQAKPAISVALFPRLLKRTFVVANITGLGHPFTSAGTIKRTITRIVLRSTYRQVSRLVFQNGDDLEYCVSTGIAKRNQASLIEGSGVDIQEFQPPRTGVDLNRLVCVAFIGRMIREKGVLEFLDAITELEDDVRQKADFVLIGPLDAEHKTRISRRSLLRKCSVSGASYLGEELDMACKLQTIDLVVLPSWREGYPRTVLEAAASGVPAVVSDVPGCRQSVVHGVTGVIVPVRDARSLAAAIATLIEDGVTRRAMGVAARSRAESEFSDDAIVSQYHELWRRCGVLE